MNTPKFLQLPTATLRPNDYNPNRMSPRDMDLLCLSIKEHGFTQPILATPDHTIVDGEHRWRAARRLGLEEIPVVVVPLDAVQARIATLRHNRARGTHDEQLEIEVFRELEALCKQAVESVSWSEALLLTDTEMTEIHAAFEDTLRDAEAALKDADNDRMPYEGRKKTAAPQVEEDETEDDEDPIEDDDEDDDTFEAPVPKAMPSKPSPVVGEEKVYRVECTYYGEDVDLMMEWLEPDPKLTLLQACRRFHAEAAGDNEDT